MTHPPAAGDGPESDDDLRPRWRPTGASAPTEPAGPPAPAGLPAPPGPPAPVTGPQRTSRRDLRAEATAGGNRPDRDTPTEAVPVVTDAPPPPRPGRQQTDPTIAVAGPVTLAAAAGPPVIEPPAILGGPAADAAAATTLPARSRRRGVLIGVGIAVVILAGALLVLFLNRPAPDPIVLDPLPGQTHTVPAPTPALDPVARDTSTPLLAAIPDEVLQWAITSQEAEPALMTAGALEAYRIVYSDGVADLTLVLAQWRSAELARTEYLDLLGLAGEAVVEEEVMVAGAPVGQMALYDGPEGDLVVWNNGATTLFVTAPSGQGLPFYRAFGL